MGPGAPRCFHEPTGQSEVVCAFMGEAELRDRVAAAPEISEFSPSGYMPFLPIPSGWQSLPFRRC